MESVATPEGAGGAPVTHVARLPMPPELPQTPKLTPSTEDVDAVPAAHEADAEKTVRFAPVGVQTTEFRQGAGR